MSTGFAPRRAIAFTLIATLIPAQGLAWRTPAFPRLAAGAAISPAAQQVPVAAPAKAPPESILDQIDESDAQIRAMATAKALAGLPTSLPFEANPNESVPVERSMSVAIKDALQQAGIDNPDNNGRATFTAGTGTVRYEGEFADGDIVVTGRLVDGRIVLTSEFMPLTNGGNVGEPVRIRGTSTQPAASVETATAAVAPAAMQTPATGPPSYNDALRLQLEATVKTITPNETSSVVMGQVHVRDTYVVQVNSMADNIESLLKNPTQLDGLVRELRQDAGAVDNAYQNMLGAEQNVAIVQGRNPRVDQKLAYDTDMRRAAALDATGDKAGADQIRQAARNTAYGNFVEKQQIFFAALDRNPLLGLGQRGYLIFSDDFLFKALRNTLSYNAPNSEYVTLVSGYLQKALDEARAEAKRAASVNTVEDLTEFGGPKYERTRGAMAAEGQANGSSLPGALADAAEGHYEAVEGGKAVTTEITNFGLNLVAGSAWVIPGIGPFIAGGAAAIQVVREGNDLYIAVLDAGDARSLAGVTGYTRVITAEDRVAAERGEFGLAVAGLALEGLTAVKIVKGPLPARTGATAADASATAVRSAPSPGGTAVSNADPKTQGAGGVWDPGVKVPGTEAEVAAAFKAEMGSAARVDAAREVRTEIQLATEAGVDPQLIKDITKNFDANGSALGNRMMADELMKARLKAQGYDIDMPREDFVKLQAMSVRAGANGSGLTPDDIAWLNAHAYGGFFENLPKRGFVTGFSQNPFAGGGSGMPTEGFVAALDAESAARLQAAWKANGGQYAGAATADSTGTVILRPGSQPPSVDPNKTVLLDPNKTALLDPNKTVLLDPNKTVLLDPNKTVLLDPNKTVLLDPNKTALLDPNKTALMDPSNPTPTVRLDSKTAGALSTTETTAGDRVRIAGGTAALSNSGNAGSSCSGAECGEEWKACSATNSCTPIDEDCGVPGTCPSGSGNGTTTHGLMDSWGWITLPNPETEPRTQIKLGDVFTDVVIPPIQPPRVGSWFNPLGLLARRLVDHIERWRGSVGPRPLINPRDLREVEKSSGGQSIGLPKGVHVLLTDRGGSTGKTLAMRILNLTGQPVRLASMPFAIEPIKQQAHARVQQAFSRLSKAAPANIDLSAYCVEFLKLPPAANQIFRLAPAAVQKKYESMSKVLRSAYRVQHAGLLRPDSSPAAYAESIKQWAVWTVEQNFNQVRFTEALAAHTKKNAETAGQPWTRQAEDVIRKVSPNRWQDIVKVLAGAGMQVSQ